ncbi:MAG: SCO family protein [Crocinitomicaceae bacterium]|nr:SCO family protein [Crocinitomicaceae bacterium]
MKRIIALALLFAVGVTIGYFILKDKEEPLPVINPIDLDEEMVDPEMLRVGNKHRVGDFSFLNQDGETITQAEVEGKVYVAEYFFTTCGTICPKMNKQMRRIQFEFADNDEVRLMSFTVDPEVDTVQQMKRYAEDHGAKTGQWHFLTGAKEDLYALARKSFFVLKPAEAQNLGDVGSDFIHTNNFVLVDRVGRIRGYYDGTSKTEVDELMLDIERLLEE